MHALTVASRNDVLQVLGHWETHLSNCNAMAVDGESGHIAVGGRGADMKNYIRVYDLQVGLYSGTAR